MIEAPRKIIYTGILTGILVIGLTAPRVEAKPADEQTQIILLNDSASALEDSNPELSKKLTLFANERENQWEKENASKTPLKSPIIDKVHLQEQVKILNQAAKEIGTTYPLITKALFVMAHDLEVIVKNEK